MLETFFWLVFALAALLTAFGVIRWSQSFPDEEPQQEHPRTASVAPELERRAA